MWCINTQTLKELHKNPGNPTLWKEMTISGSTQNYCHKQKKNYRGGNCTHGQTQILECMSQVKRKLEYALKQSEKSVCFHTNFVSWGPQQYSKATVLFLKNK